MYVHNAPGGDADAEVVPLAGAPLALVLPILHVFRWLGSRGGAATRGPAPSTSSSPAASPTPAFATAASTATIVSGLPLATLLVRSTGLACEEGDRIQKAQHKAYLTGHGRNEASVHRQRLSALHDTQGQCMGIRHSNKRMDTARSCKTYWVPWASEEPPRLPLHPLHRPLPPVPKSGQDRYPAPAPHHRCLQTGPRRPHPAVRRCLQSQRHGDNEPWTSAGRSNTMMAAQGSGSRAVRSVWGDCLYAASLSCSIGMSRMAECT
jgi:hypothetical protein